ncbi:hypothetical protein K3495_g7619 [Podosphaera aphanis]|nr:hypothetical protein K3495_g7619 [Podosphaera aphanis]
MNNSQFRKLVLETPSRQVEKSTQNEKAPQARNGVSTAPVLGSRARSSIPMTPRSVAGSSYSNNFARQVTERNLASSQPGKKFRSSAAPKGAKLPAGYLDRTKSRLEAATIDTENDKVERIKALEEMTKADQIDELTFIKLREEILGDNIGTERASLVKGLDWGLLERVKKGEVGVGDILKGFVEKKHEEAEEDHAEEDIEVEFERLEEKEVQAVVHEVTKKKGEMAPPSLTGKKKTRNQILAELKASRQAAAENTPPRLSSKFKRVGDPKSQSRIERDNKGREVLITTDEDGNEKRKVRKIPLDKHNPKKGNTLLMPDKDAKPLGMEVPDIPLPAKEEEPLDIFDDVGDDYNPLAGLDDDENSQDEESKTDSDESGPGTTSTRVRATSDLEARSQDSDSTPSPYPPKPVVRNYFQSSLSENISTDNDNSGSTKPPALLDSTTLAALKKAAEISRKINSAEFEGNGSGENSAEATLRAKEARYRRMLQRDDRDAQDMDLGFGSSRLEDDADVDESGFKLSEWGETPEGSKSEARADRKGKRKRGPKNRKGDQDSTISKLKKAKNNQ